MQWNVAGQKKMFSLFFSAHFDSSLAIWFHGQRLLAIFLDKPIIFCLKRLPAYPKQSLFRWYFVICSLRKPLILKGVWPADSSCSITGSFLLPCQKEQRHCLVVHYLPVFLSSSLIKAKWPFAVIFILPLHAGSSSFQSAALEKEKRKIT